MLSDLNSKWYSCVYLCSRYKMSGTLPLLSLRISDDKLRSILGLIYSIPLPKSTGPSPGSHQAPVLKVRKNILSKILKFKKLCSYNVYTWIKMRQKHNNNEIQKYVLASVVLILVSFHPQIKSTPQLTPRKFLNLPDQRSSLMFESCDAISITSLGTNPDFTCLIQTHIVIIHDKKIFLHVQGYISLLHFLKCVC